MTPRPLPRLLARFREEIQPALVREFSYKSPMQVPQVKKVVLNMGLGEALTNARALEKATEHMTIIAGQKVMVTKARKSIATFKIREGMSIGCMVTLRGHRMYEFLDRLLNVALPRIRDFRGVPRYSFDGNGNYSLGLKEQIVFPEIDYSVVDRIRGFQVVITTSAKSDQEGMRLLELMGMPFTREPQAN
ncbi:MAG: 50S ribosomal protein L5 [Chloroflexi bacterium]|nr:50S ribosomal protein L5 [Chloroflexota bacterium]